MSNIEDIRNKVLLGEHTLVNTQGSAYPGNYHGYCDEWNAEEFRKNLRIQLIRLDDTELEFDMIGIDASIANAFRRILLADVPTMAVEKCMIYNNTSIIQDEVLSHRLGLIPIKVDPRLFKYPAPPEETDAREETEYDHENPDPETTLVFQLKVKCTTNPHASPLEIDPAQMYLNSKVLSGHMKWVPIGDQLERLGPDAVSCVHDDILIAKLRPGHEIDITMHCVKGVGKDHAKFSPVATASYRLLPEITLAHTITGDRAERLQKCFAEGVIKLEKGADGILRAKVNDPRKDTGNREVYRDPELKDMVKQERVRDHYIFSVESTGALSPDTLVEEAIKILQHRCQMYINAIKK